MLVNCSNLTNAWSFEGTEFPAETQNAVTYIDLVLNIQEGLELRKPGIKGDSTGGRGDPIEKAVTQVLRGINGLANFYTGLDWATINDRRFLFVPVVFTTAELWVTEMDISQADL